jgi:hypothetical protein
MNYPTNTQTMNKHATYQRLCRKGIAITRKSIHPSLHAVIRQIAEQRNCSVPFLLNEALGDYLAKR